MFFEGIPYLNSEAAYQAQKCVIAGDKKQFSELSADEAKRLGSRVALRPDWNEVKISVMERVIWAKFVQHLRLAKKLLETGDKQLYEGNRWHDTFWGIDLKTREGENHLGQILMDLRQYFRTNVLPDGSIQRPVKLYGPVQGITVTDEDYYGAADRLRCERYRQPPLCRQRHGRRYPSGGRACASGRVPDHRLV